MPWCVFDKLEEICTFFKKNNITTVILTDLEKTLMQKAKISKKQTIDRYIDILLKFGWIKQIKKIKGQEYRFEITYKKDDNELF